MGSYFDSILIPGDVCSRAREVLVSWMSKKGFEPVGAPLFRDTSPWERGLGFAKGERATVVLLSEFEEGERALWELSELGVPLLRVWLMHSDAWGYQLYENREVVAEFSSHPKLYPGNPRGDPGRLAKIFHAPERQLAKLQGQGAMFMEEVVEAFCDALGGRQGATCWKYAAGGEPPLKDGELLLFEREQPPSILQRPIVRYAPHPPPPVRMPRKPPLWMRALFGVLGLWYRLKMARLFRAKAPPAHELPPPPPPPRVLDGRVFSDRWRLSFEFPAGATVQAEPGEVLSLLLRGQTVPLRAAQKSQAQHLFMLPQSVELIEDVAFENRRRLRWREEGKEFQREIVETPRGFFWFECEGFLPEIAEAAASLTSAAR